MGRTNQRRRAKRLAKQKAKEQAEKEAKQEAKRQAKQQVKWGKNKTPWDFSILGPFLWPLVRRLAGKWWQCHMCLGWSDNERYLRKDQAVVPLIAGLSTRFVVLSSQRHHCKRGADSCPAFRLFDIRTVQYHNITTVSARTFVSNNLAVVVTSE
ncbi:hypothetical protein BP00DRAFT_412220 [Aspergillus indologenus CBS 114.80]|uniref:Uncharacterized protein n=1 Tax=Aspergillus indologenus CBS 114.80 TaxID=1450541 RepID=A0A2V5IET1_9EURO|nr:hypothetical protein BP00DRAFT_412220 [Aspergillus indologenus CBS 114.80]